MKAKQITKILTGGLIAGASIFGVTQAYSMHNSPSNLDGNNKLSTSQNKTDQILSNLKENKTTKYWQIRLIANSDVSGAAVLTGANQYDPTSHAAIGPLVDHLYLWGSEVDGVQGNGTNSKTGIALPHMVNIPEVGTTIGKKLINIKKVVLTNTTSSVLTNNNKLYMWGDDSDGQQGNGKSIKGAITTPQPIQVSTTGANITDIAMSSNTSAAVVQTSDTSLLYMWGSNDLFQQTDGNSRKQGVDVLAPKLLPDTVANFGINNLTWGKKSFIKQISLADDHTAVLFGRVNKDGNKDFDNENRLFMWGSNSHNQIQQAATAHSFFRAPQEVTDLIGNVKHDGSTAEYISKVSIGDGASSVLTYTTKEKGGDINAYTTNSTVYVWGLNSYGRMASDQGESAVVNTPKPITTGGLAPYSSVFNSINPNTPAPDHLAQDERAGDINMTDKTVSVTTKKYLKVSDVNPVSGRQHIINWGDNNFGQIGNGRTSPTAVITPFMEEIPLVDTYESFLQIASAANTTIFLSSANHIFMQGDNSKGQLGISSKTVPLQDTTTVNLWPNQEITVIPPVIDPSLTEIAIDPNKKKNKNNFGNNSSSDKSETTIHTIQIKFGFKEGKGGDERPDPNTQLETNHQAAKLMNDHKDGEKWSKEHSILITSPTITSLNKGATFVESEATTGTSDKALDHIWTTTVEVTEPYLYGQDIYISIPYQNYTYHNFTRTVPLHLDIPSKDRVQVPGPVRPSLVTANLTRDNITNKINLVFALYQVGSIHSQTESVVKVKGVWITSALMSSASGKDDFFMWNKEKPYTQNLKFNEDTNYTSPISITSQYALTTPGTYNDSVLHILYYLDNKSPDTAVQADFSLANYKGNDNSIVVDPVTKGAPIGLIAGVSSAALVLLVLTGSGLYIRKEKLSKAKALKESLDKDINKSGVSTMDQADKFSDKKAKKQKQKLEKKLKKAKK